MGQLALVTPGQALAWLATAAGHRRHPEKIAAMAAAMNLAALPPRPVPAIRIDSTGRLREGKHRLLAVVELGRPVALFVDISAPAQPGELTPAWFATGHALFADGLLHVHALRYDGHNVADVRAWAARTSSTVTVHDGVLTLHTRYAGIGHIFTCEAYPGDWILYSQRLGPYLALPHSLFQQTFRKDDQVININYIFGDATAPQGEGHRLIVHVCNDIGAWGAGFVLALSARWPGPEAVYRAGAQANPDSFPPLTLGDVEFVPVEDGITVANMIAQASVRKPFDDQPPIRYDAVRDCLAKVAQWATNPATQALTGGPVSVHMPRIGCGLAGGDWADIEPIIVEQLCAKGIPVTVYDLRD